MEEKKDDIIYDLESAEAAEEQSTQRDPDGTVMESGHSDRCAVGAVTSTACGTPDDPAPTNESAQKAAQESGAESDAGLAPEGAQTVAPSGAAVRMTALHDPAVETTALHEELQRMVEEMGAETLLEIIRGNRNAAIRQIISEVEASRDRPLPSGPSAAPSCTSIFDLAALA